MTPDQIKELLAPFLETPLATHQVELVSSYLELLKKWNEKINLTAIRSPEEIVTRHFGESFFLARHALPDPSVKTSAIDLGCGAGFPGLVLKIWSSALELTLIESNQKKATFLREAVRALGLSNVSVLSERAESVAIDAALVTMRAVERFGKSLPIAQKLMAPRGSIALLIGSAQVEAAKSTLPDLNWKAALPIPHARTRVLLIGQSAISNQPN